MEAPFECFVYENRVSCIAITIELCSNIVLGFRERPMAGCCEQENVTLVLVKTTVFPDKLKTVILSNRV
jgi:hypothetical protein